VWLHSHRLVASVSGSWFVGWLQGCWLAGGSAGFETCKHRQPTGTPGPWQPAPERRCAQPRPLRPDRAGYVAKGISWLQCLWVGSVGFDWPVGWVGRQAVVTWSLLASNSPAGPQQPRRDPRLVGLEPVEASRLVRGSVSWRVCRFVPCWLFGTWLMWRGSQDIC